MLVHCSGATSRLVSRRPWRSPRSRPGGWASRAGRWSASCRTLPVRGGRGCAASPTPSSDPAPACRCVSEGPSPAAFGRCPRSTRHARCRGRRSHARSPPRPRRSRRRRPHCWKFSDVPVAVGSAGHHRVRNAAGAVRLPAAGALTDLRPLVLGDHSLELAQQLVRSRQLSGLTSIRTDSGVATLCGGWPGRSGHR